ncbi:MAG: hypothetical protein J0H67_00350 [Rhodospirillales bacterium]|nr:hypothetical protein [Rhodospirillales bacterium]
MNKIMTLAAATLMTLGVGSAFANDGDVFVPQAPANAATAQFAKPATGTRNTRPLFSTQAAPQTNVYPMFGYAGLQGGEH